MAPSIPQTIRPTLPALYAALGELLDLIPEGDTWTVGRQADGTTGIDVSILSPHQLDALLGLLGGEVRPVGSAYQVGEELFRRHRLTTTWRGARATATANIAQPPHLEAAVAATGGAA
jgi:hypothetical protein